MVHCTTFHRLTSTKQESTRQKVPERPIPAEQCTIGGPTSSSNTPAFLTRFKKSKNFVGEQGTPKSGHVM